MGIPMLRYQLVIERNISCITYNRDVRLLFNYLMILLIHREEQFEILPTISDNERWNLFLIIPRIWDTYYPLVEAEDLADNLGDLLLALDFYQEAILYFEKSIMIYGRVAETLYKIAICHCLLGAFAAAVPLIEKLRAYEPENEALQALIQEFEEELALGQFGVDTTTTILPPHL